MKKYTFNRNEFEWAEEFYEIIKQRMDLPDWFGKNPDALWDMLTGHIETPCEITLVGFGKEKHEYNALIINNILETFNDAEKEYPNEFKIIYKD
ncbi:MAG: barstar family protein [Clostridia bacterium]|nr:barstar family protein [Clostridia bacterium]